MDKLMAVIGGLFMYVIARWGITTAVVGTDVSSDITVNLLPLVIAGATVGIIILVISR